MIFLLWGPPAAVGNEAWWTRRSVLKFDTYDAGSSPTILTSMFVAGGPVGGEQAS